MKHLKCDNNMIWQSDFDPSDYGLEDIDGVVQVWFCAACDELVAFLLTDNELYIINYGVDGELILYV